MKLEICIDSYESILNAKKAGADRVEICQALDLDGLTPSLGLINQAIKIQNIEKFLMIRPRSGDFLYDDYEFETMIEDIKTLRQLDIDGFVLGILKEDGSLDIKRIKQLVDLASPKKVSLHRAFDYSRFGENQIDDLIDIGIIRILTSGKEENVIKGIKTLEKINKKYKDKIEIMAGCGLNHNNLKEIYEKTGIKNFHMSARSNRESQMDYKPDLSRGFYKEKSISDYQLIKLAKIEIDNLKRNYSI